jgi:DNA-binding beta-propeller fold protein YncE
MTKPRLRNWQRSRSVTTVLAAVLACLALLLPVVLGSDTAAAAPATAYTASLIPTASGADSVAFDAATDTAYFTEIDPEQMVVVNATTDAVTTTIPLAGSPEPNGVAVDPLTDTIYVVVVISATDKPAVVVIDGGTDTVTDTIPLPAGAPGTIAVDSSTDIVYVPESGDEIIAIDGSTNSITATINIGTETAPWFIAVDETSDVVWTGQYHRSDVFAVSGTSDSLIQTISLSGTEVESIAVDPTTDTVYVGTSSDGIAVINGATGVVSSYIDVTALVSAVAVDPSSGTLWASSTEGTGSGTTWAIDDTSDTISDTIDRGGMQIAVNSATGSAYIAANPVANGVWVLTPSAANAWSPVIYSLVGSGFTAGTYGTFTISGSALPAATYSETGALPSGLTLSPSGVLSGTPAAGTGGVYPITLTASNGVAPDYSQAFTLDIDGPPAFTSADEATFDTGVYSTFIMTTTGYPGPVFSESGALPTGVSFDEYGEFYGDPAAGTAGVYPIQVTASNDLGTATQAFTLTVSANSSFVPIGPARVLDTRNGTGAPDAPVGPGGTISLQVTGVDGVPASGVTAVVLNVTATDPTASSYVTVYPDAETRPTASNLNFTAGETIANLVTVPVVDGLVDFYNDAGSVNLVADLEGYYTVGTTGGSLFVPLSPVRVLDTRNGTGGYAAPVGPGGTISLQVEGTDGVPTTGVSAVVLNVTATDPTASSYVTVYPDGITRPATSNLNFTPAETIPNLVMVPVGADGKVDFYNDSGSVNLVADLAGYYTTSGTGSSFVALGPVRVLDTRNGTGGSTSPVGPGGIIGLQADGVAGVPATGVTAVVLNVTATDPTTSSYVTVYPDGITRPTASSLNFTAGETIPNLVVVPVGADGQLDFYNNSGSVNLVADLAGYYTSP